MEELTLHDIAAILKRRRHYALATAGALFALVLVFAMRWSNYTSSSTVQIQQSSVSSALATPTGENPQDLAPGLADQRIMQVDEMVTSNDALSDIIQKLDLYPNARTTAPVAALAAKMAKKIKLDFIGSTLSNPAEAQKASAEQLSAVAFTLSFSYSNPELARQVTAELVSRFLQEDNDLRRRQADETSGFIGAQITALETTMAAQEKKIAEFRAQHGESGPAALTSDQQAASATYLSLENIESQISANEGTQGSLRAQLATVDPYSRVIANGQVLTTPGIQLKALQAQYASLSSRYGPSHPDVVKLQHEIQALQVEQAGAGQAAQAEDTAGLQAQIQDVQTNLAAAWATGGQNNPNVAALQHQLKKLQARLSGMGQGGPVVDAKRDADNPAYLQIVAQLRAAEEQHKSLVSQHATLQARQDKYQKAIAAIPVIEQQMASLSRDYDNEQARYRELKEKKMAADMSAQLEVGRDGQRLVVSVPANLPTKTHPSKLMILAGGLVLSAVGGLVAVMVVEATSQNLYGAHQLAQLTGAAPLVSIPYINTNAETERVRRLRPFLIGGGVALAALAAVLFPYLVMPYGTFWNTLSQKFDFS